MRERVGGLHTTTSRGVRRSNRSRVWLGVGFGE